MEQKELGIGGFAFRRVGESAGTNAKLAPLLDGIREISRLNELEQIHGKILESVKRVMHAGKVSLLLRSSETEWTVFSDEDPNPTTFPVRDDFRTWVVDHKLPLIINEVEHSMIKEARPDLNYNGYSHIHNLICAPMTDADGRLLGVLEAYDCNPQKLTESEMSAMQTLSEHASTAIERGRASKSSDEKLKKQEMYLTEIHHRVKNDLALISGIVEIESLDIANEDAREVLDNIKHRIKSMAVVYELLSGEGSNTQAEVGNYFEKLVEGISKSLDRRNKQISIDISAASVTLDPYETLSCGLILNELLLNSYKHAFKEPDNGKVIITLEKDGETVRFYYQDNGPGFPDDFKPEEQDSIGFKMVQALVHQLDGNLLVGREDQEGAHVEFQFTPSV